MSDDDDDSVESESGRGLSRGRYRASRHCCCCSLMRSKRPHGRVRRFQGGGRGERADEDFSLAAPSLADSDPDETSLACSTKLREALPRSLPALSSRRVVGPQPGRSTQSLNSACAMRISLLSTLCSASHHSHAPTPPSSPCYRLTLDSHCPLRVFPLLVLILPTSPPSTA